MQRVTLTGATGLIGPRVLRELRGQGIEVTVLSRDPRRAQAVLDTPAVGWDLLNEPAPAAALAGRDAVVHLAGENVAQRWSAQARRAIRDSRVKGTENLLAGLRALDADAGVPRVLVSASAVGYYGAHREEPLDEEAPPGKGFLPEVCVAWEERARAAQELGLRTVQMRIGVVLDRSGGALAKMLPPFRLGLGGPVAGGRQYVSWVHPDDLAGIALAALQDERWSGPVNATAPAPATNRELSRALGHALHRPALLPVPGAALRALYGEMAQVVTTGARVLPAKPLMLGYRFRHPRLEEALGAALA
ncbi:MAG TPA: TIGR01777 family oxidoreductase [Solirubrobacteraceae bacterium]|nr:TIGR01777 family oxidoreductase [Solirubrobacteraceae bacterium]